MFVVKEGGSEIPDLFCRRNVDGWREKYGDEETKDQRWGRVYIAESWSRCQDNLRRSVSSMRDTGVSLENNPERRGDNVLEGSKRLIRGQKRV